MERESLLPQRSSQLPRAAVDCGEKRQDMLTQAQCALGEVWTIAATDRRLHRFEHGHVRTKSLLAPVPFCLVPAEDLPSGGARGDLQAILVHGVQAPQQRFERCALYRPVGVAGNGQDVTDKDRLREGPGMPPAEVEEGSIRFRFLFRIRMNGRDSLSRRSGLNGVCR
jgi:hypothetical protein